MYFMKPNLFVSKCFLLSLFSFSFLFLLLLRLRRDSSSSAAVAVGSQIQQHDLKIRPGYASYDAYIQRQLAKTLNPKLRKIWTTRDWDRKIPVFARYFQDLQRDNLLTNSSKSLCVGARVGQEVEALRRIGVSDSVGMDLVPYPPLVLKGDFHAQPFDDETFDFEFSNVFDHALYPEKFVGEIERTLKKGGVCVLHVSLNRRADKYSANDLYSVEPLKQLFKTSEMVHVRKVDAFGWQGLRRVRRCQAFAVTGSEGSTNETCLSEQLKKHPAPTISDLVV
ncbi:S-adenosyl-L-methionine-dependent methyltransferase [Senna tora]|uniref:S-adenosyl-L-methionine-dependent methyltransferase n=1 Tax=Senna tora TaxID=362788 RepID=A0A834X887_9FABA|nr:S-adenosyl-L-methionine-dependent methyltransferase [Senna tora]